MRAVKTFLLLLITASLIFFLTAVIPAYRKGTRVLSVQSNSMEPAFATGDVVIMEPMPLDQLEYNDIVSYRSSSDPRVIISHRLIDYDAASGRIYTKGDNVNLIDQPITSSQVVGKVTKVIPKAGYVLDFLHTPLGIVVAVYIPGGLILLSEARRLARRFSRPAYQRYGYNKLKHHRV